VQEITQRLTRRYGTGVAAWCAGIPGLAGAMAERWELALGEPFPGGNSSAAVRCAGPDGSPAVLKLSPDVADELPRPPSAGEWADLLRALHAAPVPPDVPRDLRAQCDGFFDRIGRRVSDPAIGRRVSAADVRSPNCSPSRDDRSRADRRSQKPVILMTGCTPPDHLADQAASQSSAGHSYQPLRQPRPAAAAR